MSGGQGKCQEGGASVRMVGLVSEGWGSVRRVGLGIVSGGQG